MVPIKSKINEVCIISYFKKQGPGHSHSQIKAKRNSNSVNSSNIHYLGLTRGLLDSSKGLGYFSGSALCTMHVLSSKLRLLHSMTADPETRPDTLNLVRKKVGNNLELIGTGHGFLNH